MVRQWYYRFAPQNFHPKEADAEEEAKNAASRGESAALCAAMRRASSQLPQGRLGKDAKAAFKRAAQLALQRFAGVEEESPVSETFASASRKLALGQFTQVRSRPPPSPSLASCCTRPLQLRACHRECGRPQCGGRHPEPLATAVAQSLAHDLSAFRLPPSVRLPALIPRLPLQDEFDQRLMIVLS